LPHFWEEIGYDLSMEYSNCGVGFVASLKQELSHDILLSGLTALRNVEHRGGTDRSGKIGDGAGVMTNIPWGLFAKDHDKYAVASLFAPKENDQFKKAIEVFEKTFAHYKLIVESYREVPLNESALDSSTIKSAPRIIQAFILRPEHCRTHNSFNELLYMAKQMVRGKQNEVGLKGELFFTSLSSRTIVYKAMATSGQLEEFYPDLKNPKYKTRFTIFHRRFSTNTLPSWDKVQPFRLIAHNGEINTIEGNKTAAFSREKAMGLEVDQLLTHYGTSDSGNLNGMAEALKYRSSIPHLNEILAIMIPPALSEKPAYYEFWSRAMEPWDGPALVSFCDGKRIGARLDRNGFRPSRWHRTEDRFYLCSEAGSFEIDPKKIVRQGSLYAGRSVTIHLMTGEVLFNNPEDSKLYKNAIFDARLTKLEYSTPLKEISSKKIDHYLSQFSITTEDLQKETYPMIDDASEPFGSMGDTARLPVLSEIHRSLYDYFFQNFAQVTNPPLDYIREKFVTDLTINLGRMPNIFEPKEMIPPQEGLALKGPVLSLGQLEQLKGSILKVAELDICFDVDKGEEGFIESLELVTENALLAVRNSNTVLILSDRDVSTKRAAIPSILAMRSIQMALNNKGLNLRISIVIDTGEVKNSHQVAVLIAFGASAVCPYLALSLARSRESTKLADYSADKKEQRMIKAIENGLLKVMAKRGISVLRSYRGSELFTIIGLAKEILNLFFPQHQLTFGGLEIKHLVAEIIERSKISSNNTGALISNFIYRENPGGKIGERHSLTSKRSRMIHKMLEHDFNDSKALEIWNQFNDELSTFPLNIRDLLTFKLATEADQAESPDSTEDIVKRFGSGAMSFGSISAESQRDLILAFRAMGGRSNSGEGGENPYYYTDGITAKIKQIASGRFGVTAEYLVTGSEVQIKIAQGAKPGEGGQLMGIKVNGDIAKARFSNTGVDLISPPPQHDIYSIEDLAQLIYEIKQLKPDLKISVKLVSGKNIGAIACGVVKAGADIIHVSGGNGGTGAAGLMSMKHTGLPFEIGLLEVHRELVRRGLRKFVILRTDGGLLTGSDIVKAGLLGAEEFEFGKMALVSQGCIMARICHKNTCPKGIATQDPKFKAKYSGRVENTIKLFQYIAQDVVSIVASLGFSKFEDIIGRNDLLIFNERFKDFYSESNLNLDYFQKDSEHEIHSLEYTKVKYNQLNFDLLKEFQKSGSKLKTIKPIHSTDRAICTSLAGEMSLLKNVSAELEFHGSAGQGFAAFTCRGMSVKLFGEANDGVGKSMSGGKIIITPFKDCHLKAESNVLVGNACLYGATAGEFFLNGLAGDRFAVRNSGALAIILGAGLHACEYMTGGIVLILGSALTNIGSGMTGGVLYTIKSNASAINSDYLIETPMSVEDIKSIDRYLHKFETAVGQKCKVTVDNIRKFVPIGTNDSK
jgi:glutamate synthase domain-containing protein 2/glutamate synthase domain-containing protein 1/glutamate synthase domain-containing protein 3